MSNKTITTSQVFWLAIYYMGELIIKAGLFAAAVIVVVELWADVKGVL